MAFNAEEYLKYFKFKRIRDRGENVMASCPNFDGVHERGDVRPSFGIHKRTGVSNCFRCDLSMSLEQLTSKLLTRRLDRRVNELEALIWLEDKGWAPEKATPEDIQERLKAMKNAQDELKIFDESELERFRNGVHKSVLRRGITKGAAKEWGLRYDEKSKRTVIPVRNSMGELVGAVSRAVRESDYITHAVGVPQPKDEDTLLNFKKKYILFGEHKAVGRDTALVIESPLDVIYAWGHGVSENMDLFAIFGGFPSKFHIKRLTGYKEVIIGLDNDKTGKRGEKILEEQLRDKCITYKFDHFGNKDLGEVPKEKLNQIKQAVKGSLQSLTEGLKPKHT